ncbi:MAG: ABC transporter permease [Lachnospiraceae bacterium]|nr:ABC transporter permease [Lachnospiraceae bacterium]
MNKVLNITKSTPGMVFIVTLLAGLIVHLLTGNFYTLFNISMITRAASFIIIVGFAQTLVLLTGGIDLSVASIGSLSAMVSAMLMVEQGITPIIALPLSCMLGFLLGAVNGFFIAYLRITPFIVTLAIGEIYRGIVFVVTRGMPITGVPEEAVALASGIIGGFLPHMVIIMGIICVILTIMLKKTVFGRHIYAVGGNRHCAKIVGVKTERVELMVYCLSGFLAATAGVLMTCRLSSFQATIGSNWVMPSVTAAVLGGTSMIGGVGGVIGTVIGGLLSGVIANSITLLRVSSYWETIVTGGVVITAVLIDVLKGNKAISDKIKRIFVRK